MLRLIYIFIPIFAFVLSGCQLEFGLPDGLVVTCSEEEPCSAGLICSEQHQVCVDKEPICGNGKVEFPELCDDGFQDDCGSCNAGCNGAGTASTCGDREVCPEFETCDDGYEDNCGTCNSNCSEVGEGAACGDGEVCPEEEACDDGFRTECGACNADCTAAGLGSVCGDGVHCEDVEACDDGNTVDEACGYGNTTCTSCTSTCSVSTEDGTYCGDGVVQAGFEVCDPTAGTQACASLSDVFLDEGTAVCKEDCSAWLTATCVADTGDEAKMVPVSPGPFLRGCNLAMDSECFEEENPYRQLRLSAYFIDTYEVTVAQYQACVEAGGCSSTNVNFNSTFCDFGREGRDDHPMNCVDWQQSKDYCDWAQKSLPTEAQWEKAARGTDGRRFPWGNDPIASCDYVVMASGVGGCSENRTWVVGSKPLGISPYGAYDMLGNVYEWTADWYSETYYAEASDNDPLGPVDEANEFTDRVMRGGSWDYGSSVVFRTSYRYDNPPQDRDVGIGFRCAYQSP